MEHFAFPGNIDFAADDQRIFMYSWKAHVFIHPWNNVYNQWITSNPIQMTQNNKQTSGWKSSIFNQNSSGERRLKFIASGEDDDNKKPRAKHREHRLAQRRQRRQHSDHKHVQRQRRNTTVTLQMEPMKRGNIDRPRFEKRWGDKATLTVYSKIVFDSTIRSNRYTICTWCTSRISFQRTEDSLSAFTPGATLGFTVSFILQWTVYKTDNVQIQM